MMAQSLDDGKGEDNAIESDEIDISEESTEFEDDDDEEEDDQLDRSSRRSLPLIAEYHNA